MDRPLLMGLPQQELSLLLSTLTLVFSFSALAMCASVDTTQDKHNFPNSNRIDYSVHKLITKDVNLYRNPTGVFEGTSNINIGQIAALHNLPLDSNTTWNSSLSSGLNILKFLSSMNKKCWNSNNVMQCIGDIIFRPMNNILQLTDSYEKSEGVRNRETMEDLLFDIRSEINTTLLKQTFKNLLRNYILSLDLKELGNEVKQSARAGLSWLKPEDGGKSSFLTGFGLGFLAFGLKKLLLPIFIGAQIVKSVMIAMFLPSILGGLGKLVGKGVSTFASASGSSGPSNNNVDDFEFKDNMGMDSGDSATAASKYSSSFTYPETYGNLAYDNMVSAGTVPAGALYVPGTSTGLGSVNRLQEQATANAKISYASLPTGAQHHYGSYYTRHQQPNKRQDYKVFHNIPSSSLLLTNYDPFYSPLLSRLDSVFKQLGYETETCRERLVCAMYKNPAKFAPYSNLVSAQLSRELNELRKPSTDNPEILRFFRYMKAAKDGQDGVDCIQLHPGCTASTAHTSVQPPMIKTYHDINKLVQARRLGKSMGVETKVKYPSEI